MSIAAIRKIYVLGHRDIETSLFQRLQELGVVEVARPGPEIGELSLPAEGHEGEPAKMLERIESVLAMISRFEERRGFLPSGGDRISATAAQLRELAAGDELERILELHAELERREEELKARRAALAAERAKLTPWAALEVPCDRLVPTASADVHVGSLPLRHARGLHEALDEAGAAWIKEVGRDGRMLFIVLLCLREASPAVRDILKERDFLAFTPPEVGLSPRQVLERVRADLEETDAHGKQLADDVRELAASRPRLLALHDHHASLLEHEQARAACVRTEDSFCLTGWIPADEVPRVEETLRSEYGRVEIFTEPASDLEPVPVLLSNPGLTRPFELVTDLYGRPVYHGIDPTPYLSVFFAFFFGFCLTDAGYGLLLMLISGVALLKTRAPAASGRGKFFRLFFLSGLATVVFGTLVGSWFGVTVSWKLIDPLGDLLIFMGLALAFGLVQIFTGLAIKMAVNVRGGNWEAAAWDQGLWVVLISSLVALGLSKASLLSPAFAGPAGTLSLGAAVGIVLLQGRHLDKNLLRLQGLARRTYASLWVLLALGLTMDLANIQRAAARPLSLLLLAGILALGAGSISGIPARLGMGLYSLYGISGFLGDTLSYSRLMALGLTTAIVAMIINKMALIASTAPLIGWVMALLILLAGHAFNLVINLLGAFVHTCRLQYVEFFTKFYVAGGRPFRPFGFVHRYTLPNDQEVTRG